MTITIDALKSVPYLKTEHLGDGRTVNLMPLWDGNNWRVWIDTPVGLIEGKMLDTVEGDYIGLGAAKESDLFIPFVHLMWQRVSWPDVCPFISAISDDFHNMGTSLAKLKHFFLQQRNLPPRSASRFAHTELEYLVMLTRSVFDLLQEMISILWANHVKLTDQTAERRRRSRTLPSTFSKVILRDKRVARSAAEIEDDFGLPRPLAEEYARVVSFFSRLRDLRDALVHRGTGLGEI